MWVQTLDPSTGRFTGTYVNNAAGFKCQGVLYPVEGSATGNQVNFFVNWERRRLCSGLQKHDDLERPRSRQQDHHHVDTGLRRRRLELSQNDRPGRFHAAMNTVATL